MLSNLGWTFLPPEQALAARGGKPSGVLREELRTQLAKRRFPYAGREHGLSEKTPDNLVAEICSPALNEGLQRANERLYKPPAAGHFRHRVCRWQEGQSDPIALIDWQQPENNSFVFTEEFSVLRSGGIDARRPDIVCFVNGIPLVVIEAKRPDGHQTGPKDRPSMKASRKACAISGTTRSRSFLHTVSCCSPSMARMAAMAHV